MTDLDSQLHHEQFGPSNRFRKCIECGLYSLHDPDYRPMRVAWRDWCYTCQIRGEVALERAKWDGVVSSE